MYSFTHCKLHNNVLKLKNEYIESEVTKQGIKQYIMFVFSLIPRARSKSKQCTGVIPTHVRHIQNNSGLQNELDVTGILNHATSKFRVSTYVIYVLSRH